jgi:hypothetical protein
MTPDPQKQKSLHEPALFAIYGRGRVMPPGIGKEVTAESLSGLLRFLGDRCSCTVKDQNPGLDLLMQWDWEATAEKFAAADASTARPPLYAEMPADGQPSPPPEAKSEKEPVAAQTASADKLPSMSRRLPPLAPESQVAITFSTPSSPAAESQAPAVELSQQDRSCDGFATRQRWQLGLGLAGVAVVVLAVGFMLIRRQQHASS